MRWLPFYSHLADKKTKAWTGEAVHPRSDNRSVDESVLKRRPRVTTKPANLNHYLYINSSFSYKIISSTAQFMPLRMKLTWNT